MMYETKEEMIKAVIKANDEKEKKAKAKAEKKKK